MVEVVKLSDQLSGLLPCVTFSMKGSKPSFVSVILNENVKGFRPKGSIILIPCLLS